MLTYLLGDVFRMFSGDFDTMGGMKDVTRTMWIAIAVFMAIPIVMLYLSLSLNYSVNRWTNIIAAIFFIVMNLSSLNTYPSTWDKLLLILSMGFNVLTVWHAWKWV
jgi:hypothetical protein